MILTITKAQQEAAILGGLYGVLFTFAIALFILYIVAMWRIFTKAGYAGWKSIIPVYNVWILYKIAKVNFWAWLVIPVILLGLAVGFLGDDVSKANAFAIVFFWIALIYALIAHWKYAKGLAKSFGKGIIFTIGLFINDISAIFYLILGFGKAKYVKKK